MKTLEFPRGTVPESLYRTLVRIALVASLPPVAAGLHTEQVRTMKVLGLSR